MVLDIYVEQLEPTLQVSQNFAIKNEWVMQSDMKTMTTTVTAKSWDALL